MFLTICPICRLFFSEEDNVNSTPCGHVFHATCIGEWLSVSPICPVCHTKTSEGGLIRLFLDNHTIPSGSVGVDVRTQDGVFLRFLARPPDTVGSLVRELLESREVARVHDLRLGGRSLLFGATDASSLLIRDCGLRGGDELLLVERPPLRVHLVTALGGRRTTDVDLVDGEGAAALLRRAAAWLDCPADFPPLLYLSGGLVGHGAAARRFQRVQAAGEGQQLVEAAPEAGRAPEAVRKSALSFYTRQVVDAESALPAGGDHALVVKALARPECWKLCPGAPGGLLRLRDSLAYFRAPAVVAWVTALAVRAGGAPPRFLLHCFGDVSVDSDSGEAFEGAAAAEKAFPGAELRHCLIFVESGVVFPRFPLTRRHGLVVWVREGQEVRFEAGALRAVGDGRGENSWRAGRAVTEQVAEHFARRRAGKGRPWRDSL